MRMALSNRLGLRPRGPALLTRMVARILAYTYPHFETPSKLSAVAFETAISDFSGYIVLWSIRTRSEVAGNPCRRCCIIPINIGENLCDPV